MPQTSEKLKVIWQQVEKEADERLKISELTELVAHKTVPVHQHSIWYYFGGISLLFFVIQMLTGMLLLFHYEAGMEVAYASMRKILNEVEFGGIIRSLHSWSANFMVAAVMIHMFSAYFMRAYRKPRELTWFSGTVLLLLTITLGFTGYLLPWDTIAYFATKVGLDIAEAAPWAPAEWNEGWLWPGVIAADLLRGGPEITNLTLQRFFSLHVVILPWILAAFLGFHLFMIQLHGISIPPIIEETKKYSSIPFFPTFAYDELFSWLIVLSLTVVVATIWPWGLEHEADTLASAPAGIHPEWYFMAPFEVLKWMPPSVGPINGEFIGIALFGGITVLLLAVPMWDVGKPGGRLARIATYWGIFCLLALVAFTLVAYACLGNAGWCQAMHDFFPWIVRGFQ